MKLRSVAVFGAMSCAVLGSTTAHAEEAAPPLVVPPLHVRQAPLPEANLDYHQVIPPPTWAWLAFQFLPSPQIAVGTHRNVDPNGNAQTETHTAFGLRWQLTPLLWSFGTHRAQPRWRFFVVDPMARHSGSLELTTTFEYIGGYVDRTLARPGLRVYLPVAQKGEYLSVSLGTSAYRYDSLRVAYDVGVYFLSGFLGFQVTVAPTHDPLAAIATIRLRYF